MKDSSKNSKAKKDDLDSLYAYCRTLENVLSKHSIPDDLIADHGNLINRAWAKFDEMRIQKI